MAKKVAKAKESETPPPNDEQEASGPVPAQLPPAPPQVSVPAKASCLTFLVLLLAEVITLSILGWTGKLMPFGLVRIAIISLLVLVVPIVVYRATALWMFDESSRYPDIANAWRTGIAKLARRGISLDSAPLFLVLGTGNDKLRRNFMGAADSDYRLDGGSDPVAPFYWYANAEGIFLYLNDVSWMSAAITLYEINAAALKSGGPLPSELPGGSAGARKVGRALGTLVPDLRPPSAQQRSRAAELFNEVKATLEFNPPAAAQQATAQSAASPSRDVSAGAGRYFETLTPDQLVGSPPPVGGAPQADRLTADMRPSTVSQRASNRLNSQEAGQQLQRLETVCGLLWRNRHPLCPANGILTLLPFEMLKAGAQDMAELERAVAADLATIYRELQLRCPVTAVVVGMEQERGFRELVRRIGREGAIKQRFGQRFDLRAQATEEELRKFATHVCGTFEDWVYTLFREEQALSHPGNTALYALLCKVRRTLKSRLGDILGRGFGCDPHSGAAPLLFSGCYFAATGPKSDRQAFVSGLQSKLYDEQEDIEWTVDALHEDWRRGWIARLGWVASAVILLCLICGFVWRTFFPTLS